MPLACKASSRPAKAMYSETLTLYRIYSTMQFVLCGLSAGIHSKAAGDSHTRVLQPSICEFTLSWGRC